MCSANSQDVFHLRFHFVGTTRISSTAPENFLLWDGWQPFREILGSGKRVFFSHLFAFSHWFRRSFRNLSSRSCLTWSTWLGSISCIPLNLSRSRLTAEYLSLSRQSALKIWNSLFAVLETSESCCFPRMSCSYGSARQLPVKKYANPRCQLFMNYSTIFIRDFVTTSRKLYHANGSFGDTVISGESQPTT